MNDIRFLFRLYCPATKEHYIDYHTHNVTTHLTPSTLAIALRDVGEDYIIQQCIGLTGKNGTPIFEGDVIEFRQQTPLFINIKQPYLGRVVWIKEWTRFELQTLQEGITTSSIGGESRFFPYIDATKICWHLCEVYKGEV